MSRIARLALFTTLAALALALVPGSAAAQRIRTTRTNIDSTPTGASVYVVLETGELSLGLTPLKNAKVPRGETTLRLAKEGYHDLLETVTIGTRTQSFVFNLTREVKPATLDFIAAREFHGAQVFVDDREVGALPTSATVAPGRHYVKIVREGFEPWERWIDTTEGQKLAFDIVLKSASRPKGSLLVASVPSGASVRLNGAPRGLTPTVIEDLAEGTYSVEVALDGYQPFTETVTVTAGTRATVNANLGGGGGGVGRVRVTADVEGAVVYIDGEEVGPPPVTQEVAAGKHVVEARATGYAKDVREVEVGPGETLVVALSLKAATGRSRASLRVVANVPGAQVSVDGGPASPAPHTAEDLSPGTHFVTVTAAGYATWQKSVTLQPGASDEVVAELKKAGRLEVRSSSPAEVFLDGKLAGKTPLIREDLEVGTYEVVVKNASGAQETHHVAVGTSKPVSIHAKFGAKERRVRHRAMPLSAQPIDRGYGAIDLMVGYPTILGVRIGAGLTDQLELGLNWRSSINLINEFEGRAKYLVGRSRAFAFSGEGGLGFGLGGDSRNSVFGRATALGSILISERAAITARTSLFFFTDRTGPESSVVHERRDNGAQILLGVSGEFRLSKLWNLFFIVEGDPFESGRALYDASWFKDHFIYGNAGLSLLF